MNYTGSLEDLKAVVALLHHPGHWVNEGSVQIFHCDNGDHINFWTENGELQVNGHPESSRGLRQQLEHVLGSLPL